ncbi:MAG: substrate-binding domain-containing protein, partial [Oscillospiraceae bacterium]
MKKLIALLLSTAMSITMLAGCGNKEKPAEKQTESEPQEQTENTAVDELLVETEKILMEQIGEAPEMGKGEKVGALIISTTNPFWSNMKTRYEEAAQVLGVEIDVQTGTTEGDTQSQLDTLMAMADMDYNTIIVSPINGTNLIPGIKKCNDNGIKVINLGPGVDTDALTEAGGHLDGKITVKFEDQGKTVAKDIISKLPEGGKVAILEGLSGAGQSVGRTNGATEIFAQAENIEIASSQPCDWDMTKAYEATKDIIQANPDLKGIFACNDVMALAAVEALKDAKVEGVLVYGVDYTDDAKAAIIEGTMEGSMSYSSTIYTKAAIMMAMKLAQGETFEENVFVPLTLVSG